MCTVTEIISLWNCCQNTPLDTYPQLHSLHPFLVLSLPLFPFSIMALSWCFFFHLSLPDPWRPEAGYSCCLRLPQPITVPAETRAAQTPVIFHSSVLEPNILSLSTDSLLLLLYDIGRSLLLRFFPSFSSVGVFNLSLFQPYALQ